MKATKINTNKKSHTMRSPPNFGQGKIQDLCSSNESSTKEEVVKKAKYDDYADGEAWNPPKSSFFKVKFTQPQQNEAKQSPPNKIKSKVPPSQKPKPKPQYTDKFHDYFEAKPLGKNPQQKTHFIHTKLSDSGESINSLNSVKSLGSAQSDNKKKIIAKKSETEKQCLEKKPILINSSESKKLHSCHLKYEAPIHSKNSPINHQNKAHSKIIKSNFNQENEKKIIKKQENGNRTSIFEKTTKTNSEKETKILQTESMRITNSKDKVATKKSFIPLSSTTEIKGKKNTRNSTESTSMSKMFVPKTKGLSSLSVLKKKESILLKRKQETLRATETNDSISMNRSSINNRPGKRKEQKSLSWIKSSKKVSQSPTSQPCQKFHTFPKNLTLLTGEEASSTVSLRMIKKLAQHNLTSTYICCNEVTNSLYCVKQCKVNDETIEQLIVETKIGLLHDCGYLLRVYGVGYDKSMLYLIMEYMQGGTLRQKLLQNGSSIDIQHLDVSIRSRALTNKSSLQNRNKTAECQELFCQILMALQYLHNRGIVHRDVKPQNIFINHSWNFKLGDFGSSTYNLSQEYVGTLDYAAPEILKKSAYDKSIDIWSVGCVMYEYMVGEPPFYHKQRTETIRRILAVEYNIQRIEENSLKDLISHLLMKQGKNRLTVDQALEHPFLRNSYAKRTRN